MSVRDRISLSVSESKPAIEGTGLRLRRAFGFGDTREFDPFLLLDDFRNEHPAEATAIRLATLPGWNTPLLRLVTPFRADRPEHGELWCSRQSGDRM